MTTTASGRGHRRLLALAVLALGTTGVLLATQVPGEVGGWVGPGPGVPARTAVVGSPTAPSGSTAAGSAVVPAIPARPMRLKQVPQKARVVATAAPSLAAERTVAAGLVDIDTVLDGGFARGAGTGIVLSANGTVLTNAHVVAGASRIAVTDLGNGRTYRGVVVGADPTHDVAVVQALGATGLRVAPLSSGSVPGVGSGVVGIGNAGGVGTPSAAAGVVTALGQQILAGDEGTGTAEKLTGMIATTAALRPGDSGGALVDGSGRVVGLDTAAAADASSGFAIPIARALAVARRLA